MERNGKFTAQPWLDFRHGQSQTGGDGLRDVEMERHNGQTSGLIVLRQRSQLQTRPISYCT
jgi:hypothetical protein